MKSRELEIPLALSPDDGHCADILLETISTHQGIRGAGFDSTRSTLTLQYDPGQTSLSQVETVAADLRRMVGLE